MALVSMIHFFDETVWMSCQNANHFVIDVIQTLKIKNSEVESHGFLENHVFLPTKQAGTNIC